MLTMNDGKYDTDIELLKRIKSLIILNKLMTY